MPHVDVTTQLYPATFNRGGGILVYAPYCQKFYVGLGLTGGFVNNTVEIYNASGYVRTFSSVYVTALTANAAAFDRYVVLVSQRSVTVLDCAPVRARVRVRVKIR